jgi:hypothetical protein
MAGVSQRLPLQQSVAAIQHEDTSRNLADLRERGDFEVIQPEVIRPSIDPRVEKPAERAGLPDDRSDVATFMTVAEDTIRLHPMFSLVDPQRRSP